MLHNDLYCFVISLKLDSALNTLCFEPEWKQRLIAIMGYRLRIKGPNCFDLGDFSLLTERRETIWEPCYYSAIFPDAAEISGPLPNGLRSLKPRSQCMVTILLLSNQFSKALCNPSIDGSEMPKVPSIWCKKDFHLKWIAQEEQAQTCPYPARIRQ